MIKTKQELRECLQLEKNIYSVNLTEKLTYDNKCVLWRYIKLLRKSEYHYNNRSSIFHSLMYVYYRKKRNKLGRSIGLEIWENCFDTGLTIYHPGYLVINREVRAGKNCHLHGSNCIGNNGKSDAAPKLGDNVSLGFGAGVFGKITIADDTAIGAGAIVVKDCLETNATLVGVPAKTINRMKGFSK